jgi:hypothetical protein
MINSDAFSTLYYMPVLECKDVRFFFRLEDLDPVKPRPQSREQKEPRGEAKLNLHNVTGTLLSREFEP